jgi:N-acetylmuramoyl-L-alanine amidase
MNYRKRLLRMFLVCFLFFLLISDRMTVRADVVSDGDGIIIYLDAGHDSSHAGCRANRLKEEVLNLKIALYCKEKLEEYEGVTVYLSRSGSKCPHSGKGNATDLEQRVADAASKNATLYVSLHNNAGGSSVNGATVYYPNSSYNKAAYREGKAVASAVQKRLTALGLKNRGIQSRSSACNLKYPDNSKADYYSVIRNSKLNGFPGIIIEHAYVTNRSDASKFLSTDAKLKKLGVADAKGIADYYGLHKKNTARVNLKKVAQTTEDSIKVTWSEMEGADYYLVLRRRLLTAEDFEEDDEETTEETVEETTEETTEGTTEENTEEIPEETVEEITEETAMKASAKPAEEYSEWEIVKKTTKTKFTDKDFEADKTYYYTVKAHLAKTDTFSKKNATGFSVTTK